MYEKRLTYIEVSFMISMNTKTQIQNIPGKRALEFLANEASIFPKMGGLKN